MQKASSHTKERAGFSLIEAILTVSLFGFLVTALSGGYLAGRTASGGAVLRSRATLLAEEAIEVVRVLRDQNFANLRNGTYGLTLTGGTWHLVNGSETIGEFTRRVTIAPAGTNRKQITAVVNWQERPGYDRQVMLESELTNWQSRRP